MLFQLLTGAVPYRHADRLLQVRARAPATTRRPNRASRCGTAAARPSWAGPGPAPAGHAARRPRQHRRPGAAAAGCATVTPRSPSSGEDVRRYLAGEPVRATRADPALPGSAASSSAATRLPAGAIALMLLLVDLRGDHRAPGPPHRRRAGARQRDPRSFLANLIGSADSQSRRSGGLSLKEVLDENSERLRRLPFHDPQTQFELLELIGNAYRSLELNHNAVEVYPAGAAPARPRRSRAGAGAARAGPGRRRVRAGRGVARRPERSPFPGAPPATSKPACGPTCSSSMRRRRPIRARRPEPAARFPACSKKIPAFADGEPLAALLLQRLALASDTTTDAGVIGAARDDLGRASTRPAAPASRRRRRGSGSAAPSCCSATSTRPWAATASSSS